MAKYLVETDNGKYEVETEEPNPSHPDFMQPGQEKSFSEKAWDFANAALPGMVGPINEARKNPQGAMEALPSNLAIGAGLLTGGAGLAPAMLAAGAAGAAGRGLVQAGRKLGGLPAVSPEQPTIPFTKKPIPDVPGISVPASRMLIEGATQAGLEGAGRLVSPLVKGARAAARAVDRKVIAPIQQLLTGIPGRDWLKLSKDLKVLKPEILGGAPGKKVAGEAIKGAEESAGLYESAMPTNLGKTYVEDTVKQMSRGFSEKELSRPEIVGELVKQLTPQEAFNLRHAVKNTMDSWTAGKQMPEFRQYTILKESLNNYLGEIAPAVRAAQTVFADAAQRAKLTSLLPLTKYGQPSIGRMGFAGAALGGAAVTHPLSLITTALSTMPVLHAGARATATAGLNALEKSAPQAANMMRALLGASKKAKEITSPQSAQPREIASLDGIPEDQIKRFVRTSPVGTKFTYQGKKFKVVSNKGQNVEKLSPEDRKQYFAFKKSYGGVNTFEPA